MKALVTPRNGMTRAEVLRVSPRDKSGTAALDNSRYRNDTGGDHSRERRRAGHGGTDDTRGVPLGFQNLHRGHVRAGQTTGHGNDREMSNHRCRHRHERVRV